MNAPPGEPAAKFDSYARSYDQLHQQVIGASGEDSEYFSLYKLEALKRLGASGPILDWGCGVGNLTGHLQSSFAEVYGYDPSSESVLRAQQRAPGAVFWETPAAIPDDFFGTVVLSCVLHHVPPGERDETLRRIYRALKPNGRLVVFEHNPLNPLTRKVVRDCPFDDDAILLWPRELRKRLRMAGFEEVRLSYIVFFPRFLAGLRPLEPKLSRLCLGAQTMTVGRRGAG